MLEMITDAPGPSPRMKKIGKVTIIGLNPWATNRVRGSAASVRDDCHLLAGSSTRKPVQMYSLEDGTVLTERMLVSCQIDNEGTWIFLALYDRGGTLVPESTYTMSQIVKIIELGGSWPTKE